MKQKNLYLLCGSPGAGKSTWANGHIKGDGVVFSRDAIRNELVKKDIQYKYREDKVFEIFVQRINEEIENGKNLNIYIDSTHLQERTRNQLLDRLHLENVDIYPVNFKISINTCLKRNELRFGTDYVPRSILREMYDRFTPATHGEKYSYKDIITVTEDSLENNKDE